MCERYQDKHLSYFNGHGASHFQSTQNQLQRGPRTYSEGNQRVIGEQIGYGVLDNQSMNKFIAKGVPHQPQQNVRLNMDSLSGFKNR
jgi:hypothetical protein